MNFSDETILNLANRFNMSTEVVYDVALNESQESLIPRLEDIVNKRDKEQAKGGTGNVWDNAPEGEGVRFNTNSKTHFNLFYGINKDGALVRFENNNWNYSRLTMDDYSTMQPRPQQLGGIESFTDSLTSLDNDGFTVESDNSHIAIIFAEKNDLTLKEVTMDVETSSELLKKEQVNNEVLLMDRSVYKNTIDGLTIYDFVENKWLPYHLTMKELFNKKEIKNHFRDEFNINKEPPIFTKEMQDNGELPKVGMKVKGRVFDSEIWFDIEIMYCSTKITVYMCNGEHYLPTRGMAFKPIDTRTGREKCINSLSKFEDENHEQSDYFNVFLDAVINGEIEELKYTGNDNE